MDRVFLDANVLFSAAWGDGGALRALWTLRDVDLCTSEYAVTEARRNLRDPSLVGVLDTLLGRVTVGEPAAVAIELPAIAARLPDDDRPILAAAIAMRATHLLTGDVRHFGPLLGRRVTGVLVLRPSTYLNVARGR